MLSDMVKYELAHRKGFQRLRMRWDWLLGAALQRATIHPPLVDCIRSQKLQSSPSWWALHLTDCHFPHLPGLVLQNPTRKAGVVGGSGSTISSVPTNIMFWTTVGWWGLVRRASSCSCLREAAEALMTFCSGQRRKSNTWAKVLVQWPGECFRPPRSGIQSHRDWRKVVESSVETGCYRQSPEIVLGPNLSLFLPFWCG
jgi:hypothetical protein